MDLGLYNKRSEPRGEHGTLIGNWVEERSLQQTTGFTRYEDLAIEKRALNQTQDRIIKHRDNADFGSGKNWDERISIAASTYVAHDPSNFTPKIFNQTGSHWHHDRGTITLPAKRKDMASQISFGQHKEPLTSTQGTSFLHPTMLIQTEQTPLALAATTKFVPRPFPDTNATGGVRQHKLNRPAKEASAAAAAAANS